MKKTIENQMKIILKGVDSIIDEKDLKEKLEKAEKEGRQCTGISRFRSKSCDRDFLCVSRREIGRAHV